MCHDVDRFRPERRPDGIATATVRWVQSDGHVTDVLRVGDLSSSSVVVLLHDAIGLRPFYEDVAADLAAQGHLVVAPNYFSRLSPLADGEPETRRRRRRLEMDEPRTILDFCEVIDGLDRITESGARIAGARIESIGVVGFCLGGMFALSVAAERPDVRACVTFYGFVQGQPGRSRVCLPAATEFADRIRSPLLLLWGTDDPDAYDPAAIDLFARRATDGGAGPVEVTAFPGATHGYLRDIDGDAGDPNAHAATQSWDRTLDFLSRNLLAGSPQ